MKQGFTLAELLMVMVLVAILAVVALPKYQLAVERGRSLEGVSNICWAAQYIAVQTDLGNITSSNKTARITETMNNSDLKWKYFNKGSGLRACRNDGWHYCIEGNANGTAKCVGTSDGNDCSKLGLEGILCQYDN